MSSQERYNRTATFMNRPNGEPNQIAALVVSNKLHSDKIICLGVYPRGTSCTRNYSLDKGGKPTISFRKNRFPK